MGSCCEYLLDYDSDFLSYLNDIIVYQTNSSKKRRKADAEDSDDNEFGKGRSTKEVESKSLESQKEEFPKGKRKVRKRRRLALQGRGIKDVRRRRKVDFSDDDAGPFSNSSEESMFSDDEIQGSGACPVGSDASASSDEIGSM
ncbi:serine-rich adhesin for platelets-like isoform X1 [Gossypium australe]|uniref:Serine-rich adhesin for platelets-like isoform X1 n=1 Tax=Gossypium australe TaxID=47621 RepID=A0A5B6USR7_9ROSI|nr:serine-rich adhesin for platelets-like isoform X1 [Gossypium australe]